MKTFISKPLRTYLSYHTRLNNYVKISTAAVDYLYTFTDNTEELSKKLNDLILKAGERWTPRIITNPSEEMTLVKNDINKSAIMWVYSSFDIFFKQIEGQLSVFFEKNEEQEKKAEIENNDEEDETKDIKVIELYKKLNWDYDALKPILPIFKFYSILRNCIGHNMGYPSAKLLAISNSNEFVEAINKWKTKFDKRKISAPPVVTDNSIQLMPHHAILFSETCLRIAQDINAKLFDKFGLHYFMEKVKKEHLTDPPILTLPVCSNYQRYLLFHSKNDYNIEFKNYADVFKFYENEKAKKTDQQRYETLKKLTIKAQV